MKKAYCLTLLQEHPAPPPNTAAHTHTHTPYLFISSLPKAAHNEDNRDWRLEVRADGLDVDE